MMNLWLSGRKRERKQQPAEARPIPAVWLVLGLAFLCFTLIVPMRGRTAESTPSAEAVAVMSTAVPEREELAEPEKPASVEEWSIFDMVGRFVASFLFGERE